MALEVFSVVLLKKITKQTAKKLKVSFINSTFAFRVKIRDFGRIRRYSLKRHIKTSGYEQERRDKGHIYEQTKSEKLIEK